MQTQPWHIRLPLHEHYQKFKNLIDLHAMVQSWLKSLEMNPSEVTYTLTRALSPRIQEKISAIESLIPTSDPSALDQILDENLPEELLTQMDQIIWAVQGWTLRRILEKTKKDDQASVLHVLEQASWRNGRRCSENRWEGLKSDSFNSLNSVLLAFRDSPLGASHARNPFLVKRSTPSEISMIHLECPRKTSREELKPVMKEACNLHNHWIRGFVYGINHSIMVESKFDEASQTCEHRWDLRG